MEINTNDIEILIKEINKLRVRIEYMENRLDFFVGLKQAKIDISKLPLFGMNLGTPKD